MNSIMEIWTCQKYMISKMFHTSKRLFISTSIKSIINGILPPIELIISRNLISNLTNLRWNGALQCIIMLTVLSIIHHLFINALDVLEGNSYRKIKQTMWFELFEKTSNLDLALADLPQNRTLYEEARAATSNNRCTNVLNSFFSMLTNIITLISTCVIITVNDPFIIAVILVVVIIQTVVTVMKQNQQYKTWKEDAKINKEVSYTMGLLFDRNCANELRLHSLSNWVINKYKKAVTKADEYWEKNHEKQSFLGLFSYFANLFQNTILYIYLAVQVVFRAMSIADFTLCFNSLNKLSAGITALIKTIVGVKEDAKYIFSYKKYMELQNVIAVHRVDDIPLEQHNLSQNNIVFKDVSFRYPNAERNVLKNINIILEPNKFYVIVGANGSGKTTFVNLLMRLYDPSQGAIYIGDNNINRYDYQDYRSSFGVVFQNFKVFDYSIFENVTLQEFDEEQSEKRVQEILYDIGFLPKVKSLPRGIHTSVGRAFDEEGVQLSGGEYQKIVLARALYRDSPILILDEPSSALDAYAEDELIKAFERASQNKTVFYISHRLSTARYAYKVLFIENGEISGFNTHENLLKTCSTYRQMYETQAKHYNDILN